jgi:hypothetical protein
VRAVLIPPAIDGFGTMRTRPPSRRAVSSILRPFPRLCASASRGTSPCGSVAVLLQHLVGTAETAAGYPGGSQSNVLRRRGSARTLCWLSLGADFTMARLANIRKDRVKFHGEWRFSSAGRGCCGRKVGFARGHRSDPGGGRLRPALQIPSGRGCLRRKTKIVIYISISNQFKFSVARALRIAGWGSHGWVPLHGVEDFLT